MSATLARQVSPVETAAVLTALSCRDPRQSDICTFVSLHRAAFPPQRIGASEEAVNIVGTGGGASTFNISTAAALLASAAGATVIKSGSRAYRSACGSLDVMRALGVAVDVPLERFRRMVEQRRFGFVPPAMYSALLKRLAVSIQPLNLRVIGGFINTVGPLLCPIQVRRQVTGVRSRELLAVMANAMQALGQVEGIVCWSELGMDELSPIGRTHVVEVGRELRQWSVDAEALGFHRSPDSTPRHCLPESLRGADASYNATVIRDVLAGEIRDERADAVIVNSAGILYVGGVVNSLPEGVALSREVLARGLARQQLEAVVRDSRTP